MIMRYLFSCPNERRKAYAIAIASSCSLLLLMIRILMTQRLTYAFLVWNLFLAWVPLICAWIVSRNTRPMVEWKTTWIAVLVWLLFFPNAPYLLTDLGHLTRLGEWMISPLGFDVVMLLSFTLNGLLLGFVSLFLMEAVWRKQFTSRVATALSVLVLFLAGFGMYLGRFLRWNSWDFFHRPFLLLEDLLMRVLDPVGHPRTWAFTLFYASFLIILYTIIRLWHTDKDTK